MITLRFASRWFRVLLIPAIEVPRRRIRRGETWGIFCVTSRMKERRGKECVGVAGVGIVSKSLQSLLQSSSSLLLLLLWKKEHVG